MTRKKITSLATLLTLFVGIIEHFCNLKWNENIYPLSFIKIGVPSKFINPYRVKIINPCNIFDSDSEANLEDPDDQISSSSNQKICCCPSIRSNCNATSSTDSELRGLYKKGLSCLGFSRSYKSSTSFPHSKDSPSKSSSSCKHCSGKIFKGNKNCTLYEVEEENSDEAESELGSLNNFNDSSEITSELDASEIFCPETIVNKTSVPSNAIFPYYVYLKIMDNYHLLSIKRANYIRMKENRLQVNEFVLSEIPRNLEKSFHEAKPFSTNNDKYLGLASNHTHKNTLAAESTKKTLFRRSNYTYKASKMPIKFQNSSFNGNMSWEEWEHRNKQLGKTKLRDKLGELFNETVVLPPNITQNNNFALNVQGKSYLNFNSTGSHLTHNNLE